MVAGHKGFESEAKLFAETINGGSWEKDYTEAQKEGWRLKTAYAVQRYLKSPFSLEIKRVGE